MRSTFILFSRMMGFVERLCNLCLDPAATSTANSTDGTRPTANQFHQGQLCARSLSTFELPALRLVYESICIPGPARLETEQPADEFIYEIKYIPLGPDFDTSRTKYGILADESI